MNEDEAMPEYIEDATEALNEDDDDDDDEMMSPGGASFRRTLPGRVVRLHFSCRAELPIGSQLRVTGSTLWAPTSLTTPQDPMNAHHIAQEQVAQSFPASDEAAATSGGATTPTVTMNAAHHNHPRTASHASQNSPNADVNMMPTLYTSSIEMVTTPETYPVWTTRRPVVAVLHRSNRKVQHHYYRYLVVTPGASLDTNTDGEDGTYSEEDIGLPMSPLVAATTNEFTGSTPVMMWENPFNFISKGHPSNVSISSTKSNPLNASKQWAVLSNLPYRTVDIDIATATIVDGPIQDTWNSSDDETFRPYSIRTSMEQSTAGGRYTKLVKRISDVSNDDDDFDEEDEKMEDEEEEEAAATGTAGDNSAATDDQKQILFICFHLPVVVVKVDGVWKASWSESLLAKTEGSQTVAAHQAHWVGTVSTHPPMESEQDRKEVTKILQEMDCTPVFVDPATRQDHYYGFCKQVLWPAFHNIDLLDLSASSEVVNEADTAASSWDQSRLDDWWNAYQRVNRQFADIVNDLVIDEDSYLWIHDYHLSLLPSFLQTLEPGRACRKVFFLHIPFPTSQIFRELECGEAILQGMLNADVVGFHAFDHARHFLNAAKRILGLNYESLVGGLIGVNFQNRTVLVSMSNVSIEPRMVDAALKLPSVAAGCQKLKEKHGNRRIIGGLDVGQRLSGTTLKLLAYERLLKDYPSLQSRIVMVQRVLIPNSRQADENITSRELRALVRRLQEKYGHAVIDYQEISGSSLPMDQRLSLWKASDVYMCTAIREGLNHWPMEYIYAKETNNPGVVIASEFSAVCSILNGALRVNPFDIQMTVATIDKALSMGKNEREGRRYRDIDFVSNSPSDHWVRNVLRDLKDATEHLANANANSSSATTPLGTPTSKKQNQESQGTAAFLAKETSMAFTKLSFKAVKAAYNMTKNRVIFLDFNGTIVLKEPPGKYLKREILGTSGNKPPPQVLEALSMLCADERNTVYVVSGDSSENVLGALGHIPGLGLAVSNGAKFSPPMPPDTLEGQPRRWQTFDLGVDWDAVKRVALPVLSKYTARSNGSFVKLTTFSIGWSYYSCDPEWGSLQASHLVLELEAELRAFDVRFVTLKGIVEIVPRKLNKGLIVTKVLRDISRKSNVDFIMCLGDDISDEKMFTSVFSYIAEMGDEEHLTPGPPVVNEDGMILDEQQQGEEEPLEGEATAMDDKDDNNNDQGTDVLYSYTVAVGKKPTHASTYVNDAQDVANALILLAKGKQPTGGAPVWDARNSTHLFT